MIHTTEEILVNYEVLCLNQIEANVQNLLYSSTTSILRDAMLRHYGLSMDNQERYIITSKAEVLDNKNNLLI